MSVKLTQVDVEAILACPKPQEAAFSKEDWTEVDNRIRALDSILAGATMLSVAKNHCIDRKTLKRMVENAVQRSIQEERIGYAVCIPQKRFAPRAPLVAVMPQKAHAFAFEMVLLAIPELDRMVKAYRGALPTRQRRSPAFDRLYNAMAKILREKGYAEAYPLNTVDSGRRALQVFLQRLRKTTEAEQAAEQPELPSITRIEHLFPLQPFDRIEFDEHLIDIDSWVALPLADGTYRLERVRQLWILVIVDVGSGAILAWSLVVGRKYHRLDVLELFAKALRPWSPRDLVVPDMRYSPRAWMPSCYLEDGLVPRSLMAALDNDSSHLAKMTLDNLVDYHLGILHFGRSGMGQGRAYIEATFRILENELLRYIAGGFMPETSQGARYATSTLQGDRYPIIVEFMEDLIDTYFTAHNVTSRSTREPRSPKDLIDGYLASGALLWRCPDSEEHARRLTVKRMTVTIKGSKQSKVPPLVYQDYARYRSPVVNGQWGLIGNTYAATYEDPNDIRGLTLWDDDGKRVMTLHAMTPYSQVPHSLATRIRAAVWNRNPEARADGDIEHPDNILAYHAAVRLAAARMKGWASGLIISGEVPCVPIARPAVRDAPAPLAGIRPPPGQFQLR